MVALYPGCNPPSFAGSARSPQTGKPHMSPAPSILPRHRDCPIRHWLPPSMVRTLPGSVLLSATSSVTLCIDCVQAAPLPPAPGHPERFNPGHRWRPLLQIPLTSPLLTVSPEYNCCLFGALPSVGEATEHILATTHHHSLGVPTPHGQECPMYYLRTIPLSRQEHPVQRSQSWLTEPPTQGP